MKKINCPAWALAVVFMLVSAASKAQGDTKTDQHNIAIAIPEVAILDIEPAATKDITMGFTAPTEAGLPITAPADNSTLWLNYSSIVTATGADQSRTISVKLQTLVPGVDIKVTAASYSGSGAGTTGTPASSALILTDADQDIITGIGSAYTGDGANNGHNLTYHLDYGSTSGGKANYKDLVASSATATVVYTISDN